jgi:ATP-dependent DNA helicase RecQ
MPAGHFSEWLAEWGREFRRRQTGLLLSTAHRAKGLEFDHAVVLDGGWDQHGTNEDRDAPRRLYYVAMTRARQTLVLARLHRRHVFADALADLACGVLREPVACARPPLAALAREYRRLTLSDVDLSFAGRKRPGHPVHRAIGRLRTGSELRLCEEHGRLILVDDCGTCVGRLARGFSPPSGKTCIRAEVQAIVGRWREDSQPEYRDRVCCAQWEVVVPELVYQP